MELSSLDTANAVTQAQQLVMQHLCSIPFLRQQLPPPLRSL